VTVAPAERRSPGEVERDANRLAADIVNVWARAAVNGDVVVNRYVRLACARHLLDLEEGPKRGLRWDAVKAGRAIRFFGYLRLAEGDFEGKPFDLEPWQAFIVGSCFGWYTHDADGVWVRRFRNAYVEAAKGSGKSPMAAGIGLYGMVADDEAAAEVYSAAASRDQAMILWTDAKRMVEKSPALRSRIEIGARSLSMQSRSSSFKPVSSEAKNLHGKRPHVTLVDEEHAHPDSETIDAMRAGTKGRRNALIFRITNSGFDRHSVCWHDHDYSIKVLEGALVDDAWFAFVCGLDMCDQHRPGGMPVDECEGCDQWTDESVWPKANPNLGVSLPIRYLREMVTEALGKPSQVSVVKRLCFCIWTEGSGKWLDVARFVRGLAGWPLAEAKPDPLPADRRGHGGADLSSTTDLTAFAFKSNRQDCPVHRRRSGPTQAMKEAQVAQIDRRRAAIAALMDAGASMEDLQSAIEEMQLTVAMEAIDGPAIDEQRRCYDLRVYFWLPEDNMDRRVSRDKVPYDVWARDGWITLTPGARVDQEVVAGFIASMGAQLYGVGIDRWNAAWMTPKLQAEGIEVVEVGQGFASLTAPAKQVEADIAAGFVHHDGNPVLSWMVANASAAQDAAGNIKPDKDKSNERIDGVAAWVDAVYAEYDVGEPDPEPVPFVIVGRVR
jgi:phage terminase large subunit-like protein